MTAYILPLHEPLNHFSSRASLLPPVVVLINGISRAHTTTARHKREEEAQICKFDENPKLQSTKEFSRTKGTFSRGAGGMGKSKENGTPRATCWIALCTPARSPFAREKGKLREAHQHEAVFREWVWNGGPQGPTDLISKQKAKNRLPRKIERGKSFFIFPKGVSAKETFGILHRNLLFTFGDFRGRKMGRNCGSQLFVCVRTIFHRFKWSHWGVPALRSVPGDFAVFNADSGFRPLWSAFWEKFPPKSQEHRFRSCRITFRIFFRLSNVLESLLPSRLRENREKIASFVVSGSFEWDFSFFSLDGILIYVLAFFPARSTFPFHMLLVPLFCWTGCLRSSSSTCSVPFWGWSPKAAEARTTACRNRSFGTMPTGDLVAKTYCATWNTAVPAVVILREAENYQNMYVCANIGLMNCFSGQQKT